MGDPESVSGGRVFIRSWLGAIVIASATAAAAAGISTGTVYSAGFDEISSR